MQIKYLCCSMALILSGCKTELVADVNYSQLANKEHKVIIANLKVEVPRCTLYREPEKESEVIVDLKSKIVTVLPNSEYVGCDKKGMDSYARFTTPISIGYIDGNMSVNAGTFYIGSYDNMPMFAYVPSPLKMAINSAKKNLMIVPFYSFSVKINLKNDTGRDISFSPIATYIDGVPVVKLFGQKESIKKGETLQLGLSDVSISSLLNERNQNVTPILLPPSDS